MSHTWISHVTQRKWVMSNRWISHVTHMNIAPWEWTSHVTHMNQSCHTKKWVTSYRWISHVTHMNIAPWQWTSYVTHMNQSSHTKKWVMSHRWMSHVTHMNHGMTYSSVWHDSFSLSDIYWTQYHQSDHINSSVRTSHVKHVNKKYYTNAHDSSL